MPDQEVLKRLEERLTRLEATLSGSATNPGSFQAPGGVIADPAPWPGNYFIPRPPYPNPVVDPAPWGGGFPSWGGTFPWYRIPIPNPVADPAPWGGGQVAPRLPIGTIGQIGDPPPIDIGRFSAEQLESSLHTIAAERARLDSMEQLVKQQLKRVKSRD